MKEHMPGSGSGAHGSRVAYIVAVALGVMGIFPTSASASTSATWSEPFMVAEEDYVFTPTMSLSDDGSQAISLWSDSTELLSRAATVDGNVSTWGSEIPIGTSAPGNVEVALSGDGRVALATWRQDSNLAQYAIGTVTATTIAWSQPVSLGCNCIVEPALSTDGSIATLLYQDTQGDSIISKSGYVSGHLVEWSAPTTLSSGFNQVGEPLLGMSADGTRVFALFGIDTVGFTPVFKSVAGTVTDNRPFAPIVAWGSVSSVSNGTRSFTPQLAFSRDGSTALVAWYDFVNYPDTRVYSRTAEVNGNTAVWEPIDAHTGQGQADIPRVAVSGDGSRGLIAWQRYAFGSDTQAIVTRESSISAGITTWGSPVDLPESEAVGYLFETAMASDGSRALVMWTSGAGGRSTPTVSATDLLSGLLWDQGSSLSGALDPTSASYPEVTISSDGTVAAATWTWIDASWKLFVNTGEVGGASPSPGPTPNPAPPIPASEPRGAVAVASEGAASVSWQHPSTAGSFPISHYQVIASPGGRTCLVAAPAMSCTVERLTNGTAYTFTVQALTGAGWSAESPPSNAVTPRPMSRPTIVISGSREGRTIAVSGTTTGMGVGGRVTPWTSKSLSDFVRGREVPVSMDSTFTWSRRASGTQVWRVYFTAEQVRSNTVAIR